MIIEKIIIITIILIMVIIIPRAGGGSEGYGLKWKVFGTEKIYSR